MKQIQKDYKFIAVGKKDSKYRLGEQSDNYTIFRKSDDLPVLIIPKIKYADDEREDYRRALVLFAMFDNAKQFKNILKILDSERHTMHLCQKDSDLIKSLEELERMFYYVNHEY